MGQRPAGGQPAAYGVVTVGSERATMRDMMRVKGKAELVAGRIVVYPLMEMGPGLAKGEVIFSLDRHVEQSGLPDEVFGGSLAYGIPCLANGRESFCPDGSYYHGPRPDDPMSWMPGPPTFVLEVRRAVDDGPEFDPVRAAKRADYFEAGTRAIWDVDPFARFVALYLPPDSHTPSAVFTETDTAHAEPAVPGWRVAVADLFV